jgi:hypothetical protein
MQPGGAAQSPPRRHPLTPSARAARRRLAAALSAPCRARPQTWSGPCPGLHRARARASPTPESARQGRSRRGRRLRRPARNRARRRGWGRPLGSCVHGWGLGWGGVECVRGGGPGHVALACGGVKVPCQWQKCAVVPWHGGERGAHCGGAAAARSTDVRASATATQNTPHARAGVSAPRAPGLRAAVVVFVENEAFLKVRGQVISGEAERPAWRAQEARGQRGHRGPPLQGCREHCFFAAGQCSWAAGRSLWRARPAINDLGVPGGL